MPSLTTMSSNSSMPSDSASSSGFSASDSPSSTDENNYPEALIYITFHEEKKSSHAHDHPRSLNAMINSSLATEPMIPDLLYVDCGLMNGVIAGRIIELLAQARPESRRPDIKRLPYPKDSDEEAIDRGELDPQMARIRRRLRHLATRYRCIMVIGLPSLGPAMADVRGWNIGEGLYEKIRFLEDCDSPMFELDGEAAFRKDYGTDALAKY